MAELSKLLGFMSDWDRSDALQKYEALFNEASSDEELIESLGSPTKLAISLALNYVPSPAPVSIPVEVPEEVEKVEEGPENSESAEKGEESEESEVSEVSAASSEEGSAEEAPLPAEEGAEPPEENEEAAAEKTEEKEAAEEDEVPCEAEDESLEELPEAAPRRKVRAFGLLASIILGLIIGVPVFLCLICVGIPFVVSGLGLAGGTVWAVISAIPMLSMFSDILVVLGVALVLCALGLLLFWFGLWVCFELGYLWMSGVVLRVGRALTYKKEVAAE